MRVLSSILPRLFSSIQHPYKQRKRPRTPGLKPVLHTWKSWYVGGFSVRRTVHGPKGPVGSKLRLLRKANSMLYAMRHVDYEFNIIKKKKKRPILRVHSSGTIPERDYTEEKQDAFFWVTFQFLNERNTILVIPPRRWMNRISSENGLSVYSHTRPPAS